MCAQQEHSTASPLCQRDLGKEQPVGALVRKYHALALIMKLKERPRLV